MCSLAREHTISKLVLLMHLNEYGQTTQTKCARVYVIVKPVSGSVYWKKKKTVGWRSLSFYFYVPHLVNKNIFAI